jgi:hypothetical protein
MGLRDIYGGGTDRVQWRALVNKVKSLLVK